MCGTTSDAQDRVIEEQILTTSDEEKTMTSMTHEPFLGAELDYRLDRAKAGFGRPVSPGGTGGARRHRVPRRPTLHLPRPRRRPLSLA
jgi:hypothetical protein